MVCVFYLTFSVSFLIFHFVKEIDFLAVYLKQMKIECDIPLCHKVASVHCWVLDGLGDITQTFWPF